VSGLAACLAVIAAVALGLFMTSPVAGDFWWSDAPRHGLNGIFLAELLRAAPLGDPVGFAYDFYAQYPALTILFYPPLFYAVSSPAFLLFGESHAVAQAVVALHLFVLGAGTFALARFWFERSSALACATLLLALPEIGLWGRQVMLEIPALALLVWASVFVLHFVHRGRTVALAAATLFALAALYTKISMVFVLPALLGAILAASGWRVLRQGRVWVAGLLGVLGLVPLMILTLRFGQANVQSVVAIADTPASRRTLAGWTWYAERLPEMLGWPALAFAAIGLVGWLATAKLRGGRAETLLLPAWFILSYAALSFVELKEARHGVILLVPVAIWAVIGLRLLLSPTPSRLRGPLAAAASILLAIGTMAFAPVPAVGGYREAARFAAAEAPPGTAVLFSGKRDGSFVFNMRTATTRRDLMTVRADKLLLSIAVRRDLGVRETNYTDDQIRDMLRDIGVSIIVAQRDFWVDLGQMAALQRVLDGPDFEEIRRIPVEANLPVEDRELRIYRARWDPRPARRDIAIDLPIIGRRVQGRTASP